MHEGVCAVGEPGNEPISCPAAGLSGGERSSRSCRAHRNPRATWAPGTPRASRGERSTCKYPLEAPGTPNPLPWGFPTHLGLAGWGVEVVLVGRFFRGSPGREGCWAAPGKTSLSRLHICARHGLAQGAGTGCPDVGRLRLGPGAGTGASSGGRGWCGGKKGETCDGKIRSLFWAPITPSL